MALTTINPLEIKQQVKTWLANMDPGIQMQVLAWLEKYAPHHLGQNTQFYFESFSDLTGDQAISDAACKLHVVYCKKQATATDAFFKATDHGSVSAGDAAFLTMELNASGDECVYISPKGLAQGTGVTINSSTTVAGTTDTSSGDGPDGFVIVGDA